MNAIVLSIIVLAATVIGLVGFVAMSLLRRHDAGDAGLSEAEGIIREAIATSAAPRAKVRAIRRAA